MSKMREKESLECVRMHIWALKTQKLPGPLSGPWTPATDCSLHSRDSALLRQQFSASEAGPPLDQILDPHLGVMSFPGDASGLMSLPPGYPTRRKGHGTKDTLSQRTTKAGGTHPTGMLSCYRFYFISNIRQCNNSSATVTDYIFTTFDWSTPFVPKQTSLGRKTWFGNVWHGYVLYLKIA